MTITKARKTLGDLAVTMSDEQIQALIDSFVVIIDVGFQSFDKKNLEKNVYNGKK